MIWITQIWYLTAVFTILLLLFTELLVQTVHFCYYFAPKHCFNFSQLCFFHHSTGMVCVSSNAFFSVVIYIYYKVIDENVEHNCVQHKTSWNMKKKNRIIPPLSVRQWWSSCVILFIRILYGIKSNILYNFNSIYQIYNLMQADSEISMKIYIPVNRVVYQ